MAKNEGQSEALRKKSLGELGELISIKALVDASFEKIVNLNDKNMNYPYADLYAEKEGQRCTGDMYWVYWGQVQNSPTKTCYCRIIYCANLMTNTSSSLLPKKLFYNILK